MLTTEKYLGEQKQQQQGFSGVLFLKGLFSGPKSITEVIFKIITVGLHLSDGTSLNPSLMQALGKEYQIIIKTPLII